MSTAEMEARDLYLKYTPKSGGAPRIQQHRVWDAERFFAAQTKAYGADAKPADRETVEVSTKAAYEAARKAGK